MYSSLFGFPLAKVLKLAVVQALAGQVDGFVLVVLKPYWTVIPAPCPVASVRPVSKTWP